jgi:hypothetical protein
VEADEANGEHRGDDQRKDKKESSLLNTRPGNGWSIGHALFPLIGSMAAGKYEDFALLQNIFLMPYVSVEAGK